ncbi:uncharacterized protein LOC131683102 isoform X2 [Topomyia yanbarensis]|uniref:uncharacterized protein LOC131683102 isoform X2 n=1 Tax=Topomyia yanbarensis TaxID=2498891 RepID=UPI00273B7479|nr:uncharacterized protein LOC131683102 isoform X2 [Topomyia yanbarensis]
MNFKNILATFVVVGMMWMSTLCKPIPIPESAKSSSLFRLLDHKPSVILASCWQFIRGYRTQLLTTMFVLDISTAGFRLITFWRLCCFIIHCAEFGFMFLLSTIRTYIQKL